MTAEIEMIDSRIKELRAKITRLWNERGKTDQEILEISLEMDELFNTYQQLIAEFKESPAGKLNFNQNPV